jgi:3-methyladenine DNA glycosylase AlkD
MLTANQYYEHIRSLFSDHANPEIAEQQVRYMKDHFEYFGMKAPTWQPILKNVFSEFGMLSGEELHDFITVCFEDDCREMQYAAIEMTQKGIKKQPEEFIHILEYMIATKSWWDSVDWIATLVGIHFQRYPHLIEPTTERWMQSGYLWLQRICIIFQLKYKEKTDLALLSKYILAVANSKEFFLQKAAGWALRDLSRKNPNFVINFVAENPQLAPLTKREALRLL